MNPTHHPLHGKTLLESPTDWSQWLERWKSTNDPLALQSLLHHGPDMLEAERDIGREEALLIYLQLATNWYKDVESERLGFGINEHIFTCPKKTLAKVAFKTLCKHGFKTGKHAGTQTTLPMFVYSNTLLAALITFLGSDSIETLGHGGDPFASHFVYAKDHDAKTLKDFCLALARFLIREPYRLLTRKKDTPLSEEENEWIVLWQAHQRSAMKILLHFEQYSTITELAGELSEIALIAMSDYITRQEIVADWNDGQGPRRGWIQTLDNINVLLPASSAWRDNAQLVQICFLYLGLRRNRNSV